MLYPKINTIWKRDPNNNFRIIEGEYSCPEFSNIRYWEVTEKIDGMNIRIDIDFNKNNISIMGRTDNAQIPMPLLNYINSKNILFNVTKIFSDSTTNNIILFGEGYGKKIQKVGHLYRDDMSFMLFDIWIDGWWLERENIEDIANKLNIEMVPLLYRNCQIEEKEIIDFIKTSPKSTVNMMNAPMEGVVCRSKPLMLFRNGNPIMWKIKAKDYA